MKNLLLSLAVATVALFSANTASAQSPSQALGLGVTVGDLSAVQISYALDPAIHIGTAFGLALTEGTNMITFAPYGKFLFKGSKTLKPFIQAQFLIVSGGGATNTGLGVGGGAEYFITPEFGIFGQFNVLNAGFGDNGTTSFGVLMPRLGAEWFL